jgi:hypothetical protein
MRWSGRCSVRRRAHVARRCTWGINGLMAEMLEDHIRLHLLQEGRAPLTPDLGEELIDLVRAYLK